MALHSAGDAALFRDRYPADLFTVVLATGCFDLLHVGHLGMLEDARALGDILIVGVNADARVRALKGPGQPVVREDYRARMLEALRCVDFVFVFPEDLPSEAILTIRPTIFVKGRYMIEDMPEKVAVDEVGGRVEIIHSERMGADLHTSDLVRCLLEGE